MVEIEKG